MVRGENYIFQLSVYTIPIAVYVNITIKVSKTVAPIITPTTGIFDKSSPTTPRTIRVSDENIQNPKYFIQPIDDILECTSLILIASLILPVCARTPYAA